MKRRVFYTFFLQKFALAGTLLVAEFVTGGLENFFTSPERWFNFVWLGSYLLTLAFFIYTVVVSKFADDKNSEQDDSIKQVDELGINVEFMEEIKRRNIETYSSLEIEKEQGQESQEESVVPFGNSICQVQNTQNDRQQDSQNDIQQDMQNESNNEIKGE